MASNEPKAQLKITINKDRTYAGHLTIGGNSFDIAAPGNATNVPSSGRYYFERAARIPRSQASVRVAYGPIALYFVHTTTKRSLVIHGGDLGRDDELETPNTGLSMHNSDLIRLAEAIERFGKNVDLLISFEDIGWIRKMGRTRVVSRRSWRIDPSIRTSTVRQYQSQPRGERYTYNDSLVEDPLFWLILLSDHDDHSSTSTMPADSPLVPGGGTESGAGASGSFDDPEPDAGKSTSVQRGIATGVVAGVAIGAASILGTDSAQASSATEESSPVTNPPHIEEVRVEEPPPEKHDDPPPVEEKTAEPAEQEDTKSDSSSDSQQDTSSPSADSSPSPSE